MEGSIGSEWVSPSLVALVIVSGRSLFVSFAPIVRNASKVDAEGVLDCNAKVFFHCYDNHHHLFSSVSSFISSFLSSQGCQNSIPSPPSHYHF